MLTQNEEYQGKTDEDIEATIEEIEKYTMRKMFKNIFPTWPSIEDTRLFRKTLSLSWM
jgi:hypothetical protein